MLPSVQIPHENVAVVADTISLTRLSGGQVYRASRSAMESALLSRRSIA